jgi:hypothetical protein
LEIEYGNQPMLEALSLGPGVRQDAKYVFPINIIQQNHPELETVYSEVP